MVENSGGFLGFVKDRIGGSSGLPRDVLKAASAFRKRRFEYFINLADLIDASGGQMNYMTIFEREADRYAGTPRGRLAAHWVERMHETGARISETWHGCVPPDELAVIAIAEARGRGAVTTALRDLARVGGTINDARLAFIKTVFMSLIGLVLASVMLLAVPFFFRPFFEKSFGFIPAEFYGPNTVRFYALADFIGAFWWIVLPLLLFAMTWVTWSLPNWTGPKRSWADERIFIYKLYRDFKGALFLASFASLTRSAGAEVTNQRNALLMMQSQVQPWLRWKINLMLSHMDDHGALDASMFDVGVVDKEVYFRVVDIVDARGISEGLTAAGLDSEGRAVKSIRSKGAFISVVAMGSAVMTVLGLLLWIYVIVFEFKSSIGTWANQ